MRTGLVGAAFEATQEIHVARGVWGVLGQGAAAGREAGGGRSHPPLTGSVGAH